MKHSDGGSRFLALVLFVPLSTLAVSVLAAPIDVAIGDVVAGALEETDSVLSAGQFFDEYRFDGIQGQEILISLSSLEFDAFLWLLDSTGNVVTTDDDSFDRGGAVISQYVLPATGSYTLWVSSYGAAELGDYVLWLGEAPATGSATPIDVGQSVEAELSQATGDHELATGQLYDVYALAAAPGQAISIRMEAAAFDSFLWLLAEDGRVLSANDTFDQRHADIFNDGFESGDTSAWGAASFSALPAVVTFFPPTAGTYTLLASSRHPQQEGAYNLHVDANAFTSSAQSLSDLASGALKRSDIHLSTGQYLDVYAFDASVDQVLTLELATSAFDAALVVLDESGNVMASDDDSGVGFGALIADLTVPIDGTYYAWVRSIYAGEVGSYTIQMGPAGLQTQSMVKNGHPLSLTLSRKPSMREASPRKGGTPFVGADRCLDSSAIYTAKVEICIGDSGPLTSSVHLSGPAGVVIDPTSLGFTVAANDCVTVSPFSITTVMATEGVKTIMAEVPGLGSDSEPLHVVKVEFTPDPVVVIVGKTAELTATITPIEATDSVSFETADFTIATVSGVAPDLIVSGVTLGQTQIVAEVESEACSMVSVVMPAIEIEKSSNATSMTGIDDEITYTYDVKNTGAVMLDNVEVNDPQPGLSEITCIPAQGASLAPNATMHCKATYTVTEYDIAFCEVVNTGEVSGESSVGTVSDFAFLAEDIACPEIELTKKGTLDLGPDGVATPGDPINYTFNVSNTGNVTLSQVMLGDGNVPAITCPGGHPIPSLGAGASVTCTGRYAITQDDINAGIRNNTAIVTGRDPGGDLVRAEASDCVSLSGGTCANPQNPGCNNPNPMCLAATGIAAGCGDLCQCEDMAGDPNRFGQAAILPHSGQEIREEIDLTIEGRDSATTLQIMRRHLTGVDHQDSIFGPAWAFNYRHAFVENADGDLEMLNFGRMDVFERQSSNVWEDTSGRFDRASYDGGSITTLRMSGGTRLEFHTELEDGLLVGHLTAVISPNDNRIVFTYESEADEPRLLKRKLLAITESYGRLIELFYEDPEYPIAVSRIRDFSGREVIYDYNSAGQILSARSPTVTSTAGVNDFPGGKTTLYTYLDHANHRLRNAVTSVVFPNQEAGGLEPRLTWTYDTDPASPAFGRVISHTVGNPAAGGDLAAGGTYTYDYDFTGGSLLRTTATDRRGTETVMDFTPVGNMVNETIKTQGFRPSEPSSRSRDFDYNIDGDMIRSIDAMGIVSDRIHVDPSSHPRNSQANETDKDLTRDPGRPADQEMIFSETIYEPIFNKPFQTIDPRGFEGDNTPEQFTTTYHYDYMEDLAAARAHFAPQLGLSEAALQTLFDQAGITDQASDVNGDGITDQFCGNRIQVIHPDVTLPPEASRVGLGLIQQAEEIFRFNDFGQILYHRDAEENVTLYEYFGADDPDGDGAVDVAGADSTTGGYLKQVTRDAEAGSGRNSGHDPTPVVQVTRYEYTDQSAFPANPRGVPTAVIDPRGIRETYLVNELDQVVTTVRAADVSESPESGLVAFAYERTTIYDANDNVVEERIQNKDTLNGDDDFIVHRQVYDILDQRIREEFDVGGLDIVNSYAYDASQNLVEQVRGVGSLAEATERWTYDERDIVVTHTRAADTPEESTVSTEIDDNGNIVRWIDAEGDDVTDITHDGFDRKKETIDRVGNRTVHTYDAASNVVGVESWGPVDGQSATAILLAASATRYDERNRPFRSDQQIFHYLGLEIGTIDDGALDPDDGLVSMITIYDRLSRAVGTVDAEDDTSETRYDGLSRVLKTIDPEGNSTDRTYDPSNNLLTVTETETSDLIASDEVFVTTYTYDSLNRGETVVEPNGQTTTSQYDSRDNLIKTIDQLGNEVEIRYDRLDRLVDTRRYLSADGTGATASNVDVSQGGGDGVITIGQSWDELHRLASRTDDSGNVTAYVYDDLDRKVRCDYADGTFETWVFNADSELVNRTNQNGSVETWTYDEASRPTQVTIDNSGASVTVLGTTEKRWEYDGLDRVTLAFDDNGLGEDVTSEYVYDSLSRQIRETQTVGARGSLDFDSEWQGAARNVSDTYPNGRKVNRSYDGLDRLFEISEDAGGSLITRFEYVGPFRDVLVTHGNGSVLDKRNDVGSQTVSGIGAGYDRNRRHLRHEWKTSGGAQITGYVNTYNGPGGIGTNRRVSELREHMAGHLDTYGFDSAYRMVSFLRDGAVMSTRVLDGADKMTAFVDEGVDRMPVVDGGVPAGAGMNQYSSFDGNGRVYDENSSLANDGDLTFGHDYQNRIVEIRDAGSGVLVARYTYASDNRRVLSEVGVGVTRYLYDGWQVVEERGGAGEVLRQYVDGRGIDEHCQIQDHTQGGEPVFYYHGNSQGFVGALTDAGAGLVETYEYSWLGEALIRDGLGMVVAESVVGNRYGFQGRRLDGESGLYYYRNRYYSAGTGEFVTIDPLGNWEHGQGNGFSAFGEDSWGNLDPLGLGDLPWWYCLRHPVECAKGLAGRSEILCFDDEAFDELGRFNDCVKRCQKWWGDEAVKALKKAAVTASAALGAATAAAVAADRKLSSVSKVLFEAEALARATNSTRAAEALLKARAAVSKARMGVRIAAYRKGFAAIRAAAARLAASGPQLAAAAAGAAAGNLIGCQATCAGDSSAYRWTSR